MYSKYIGVTYTPPRKGFNGEWNSKFQHKGHLIVCGRYRDSEGIDEETMEILCAIDRECKIIEGNYPNKRNFTDEELNTLISKYKQ